MHQVRSGQVQSGPVRSSQVQSGPVRSSQVKSKLGGVRVGGQRQLVCVIALDSLIGRTRTAWWSAVLPSCGSMACGLTLTPTGALPTREGQTQSVKSPSLHEARQSVALITPSAKASSCSFKPSSYVAEAETPQMDVGRAGMRVDTPLVRPAAPMRPWTGRRELIVMRAQRAVVTHASAVRNAGQPGCARKGARAASHVSLGESEHVVRAPSQT